MTTFKAIEITKDVYWVGATDWTIRNFHGYATHRGTTYNAYLIVDEKVTLIDTVKYDFREEMFARIASVIDPRQIDYLISNHSELDHSGAIPYVKHLAQPEKIIASKMGALTLKEHNLVGDDVQVVKDGETINLGKKTLKFFDTKMLHWPDSMFSYLTDERILFSQDAFGMHLATAERFDDELPFELLRRETAKYYANILLPYSPMVKKLLSKLSAENVKPAMIAPDHGPVWRQDPSKPIELYQHWADQKPVNKAVVVYDTMWNSTGKMAQAIVDGLYEAGTEVVPMHMSSSHRSDAATEILEAGALIVGSPTLNNNLFPTIADTLVYLKGLRRTGLIGAVFGSYGWGGEAFKQLEEYLTDMKVEIVSAPLKAKYSPNDENLQNCFVLGQNVGAELAKRANQ
ncbi:FprA family A-type flavoprotein [bacterium]|nr:FprA family A-type flavoprotein [bacterium]